MNVYALNPKSTALLFFDTLNVYLHPDDAEARVTVDKSGVIPRYQKLAQACRAKGVAVFYAQADHRPDHRDFAPLVVDRALGSDSSPGPRLMSPPAAVSGSRAAEIIPEIAPQPGDYVVKKHRWSAFYQTHLELSLRTAGIETIILVGGSTEVGVASTAYSARDRDFNLVIVSDACTSRYDDVKRFFMERVFPGFARVMTADEVINSIQSEP